MDPAFSDAKGTVFVELVILDGHAGAAELRNVAFDLPGLLGHNTRAMHQQDAKESRLYANVSEQRKTQQMPLMAEGGYTRHYYRQGPAISSKLK